MCNNIKAFLKKARYYNLKEREREREREEHDTYADKIGLEFMKKISPIFLFTSN